MSSNKVNNSFYILFFIHLYTSQLIPSSYFRFFLFCPLHLNWVQHVANLCSSQIPNFHTGLQNVGVEGPLRSFNLQYLPVYCRNPN